MPDQYAIKHTYQIGNAEVIVYRPNISEEERKQREAALVHALERFGRAMERKGDK